MPERNHPTAAPPAGWHEAFAALPLEAPREDKWPRIAAALPGARRPRRVLPWALAAATASLAALPALQLLRQPASQPEADAHVPAPTTSMPAAAGTVAIHQDPAPEPAPIAAKTPDAPAQTAPTTPATVAATREPAAMPAANLRPLQEESARLERLLGSLAGTQGGDALQLALAASLQAQVAGIDDALARPALDEGARAGLWQQRVEALRELASLAADQRWQALYGGDSSGYALVQVY
ncbi:hypothetical protein [Pseudoxanthomonas suwonensis]|uniref:hypothetical protein n=1 Tax=Pseudoxanthomonas suwonensis TaxID=314722 RepID=UPI000463852E|nr:hypothetical protein [Pseudoxanthomonas suwonensis]